MSTEKNIVNKKRCRQKIKLYELLQSELIFLQFLKKALFEDYKNREFTKKEFQELVNELEENSILFNLASEDIEKQLLEELGEEFIRKLKGGQFNG